MVASPAPTADALLDEIARLRALLAVETPREKELEQCLQACAVLTINDTALLARVKRVLNAT